MTIQELYTKVNAKCRNAGFRLPPEIFLEDISVMQLKGNIDIKEGVVRVKKV